MFLAGLVTMRLEYFIQLPDSHADALACFRSLA